MARPQRLNELSRGAPPPAFGSPRSISAKMKCETAFGIHLGPNTPGVRGLAPGASAKGARP
jgi:hypothetical protein